jgi:hypothetical protein
MRGDLNRRREPKTPRRRGGFIWEFRELGVPGTQYLTPCFRSRLSREETAPGELLQSRVAGSIPRQGPR